MADSYKHFPNLPPEQQAIRAKCFHPTGTFVEFEEEEIGQSIPGRFEKIVRIYSDHVAVKTKHQQITYDALNRTANRLARAILSRSEEGQQPVVLLLHDGISLSIATLAVFKTGNFVLGTNSLTSPATIARTFEESRAIIVTDSNNALMARDFVNTDRQLINLDEVDFSLNDENLKLCIAPDAYAYIKYTSGSTGQAKGVLKTHRYVLNAVGNFINFCRVCADDRLALLGRSSLFNDLLTGATLCPIEITREEPDLAHWLIREGITIFRSFPTAFRHFVSTLSGQERFPNLRLVRLGGEPLYKTDVELYKRYCSSECLLVSSYGSTETGAICHYFIDKNTEITSRRVPVGYPLHGMEVSIMDDLGNKTGFNQPGEIVVKSRFLSRGYWQKDKTTRDKFQSTPFNENERTYLTGDRGKMSMDGCLEYLGRKDSVIKIRSFRADLVEVEETLLDHPLVKEVTVITKKDNSGNNRLVAYFVPRSHPPPTVTRLRDFLKERLPDYMIPSVFVAINKFPMLSTGKVDRRSLPDPGKSRPDLDTVYVAPRTSLEEEVVKIWVDILSLAQIGVHDDFFDLGGHSLAATRVVSQILRKFQLEIPMQSLFAAPTVAEMAAVIAQQQGQTIGEGALKSILNELESLSDEETKRRLENEMKEIKA